MGEVESGAFDEIVWNSGNYFLKVGVDPEGGDDYINIPDYGTGTWSIINGTGGEILDSTNHHSTF